MMTDEEKRLLISRVATQLGDHFDAVQIMASWKEEGDTRYQYWGQGNWFARKGMAHQFLEEEHGRVIGHEVGKVING